MRPSFYVDAASGEFEIDQLGCDADVGDGETIADQELFVGNLLFEVVEQWRNFFVEGLLDRGFVGGVVHEARSDHARKENLSTGNRREPFVAKLLVPESARILVRINGIERRLGMGPLEIPEDNRRIGKHAVAVTIGGNSSERMNLAILGIGAEGNYRVMIVFDPFLGESNDRLPHER